MNFDLEETNEQRSNKKMIKPPQVGHNNWVLLKDPKSKESQHIPLLLKSQIRKIQRRYTACHYKITSKVKKQMLRTEVVRPNPRLTGIRQKKTESSKLLKSLKERLGSKMRMH